ncbi:MULTISPECIES: hypothetical protein [Rahnella]|uniref:Fimbrial protein n=1 Tax=Rahnella laticis TaxID=2787622 RepID=A0ABS0E4V8_9GAMM|nr:MULTISPECIES: hypothetical protein [Rahnella]MBF7979188.1 hypothetical protein [Rahnella laticis]MBF7999547.1 hypothetical protein [Rahnella sp. LAC-M12]
MKFLSRYAIYTVVVFYCAFSSAVTISADTTQTVSGSRAFSRVNGNTTIIVTLRPANGGSASGVEDQNYSYDCPINIFTANAFDIPPVPSIVGTTQMFESRGTCKKVTKVFSQHSAFTVNWSLTNKTLQEQTLQVYVVWLLSGGNSDNADIAYITIPANSTCSATVDNVDLGTVKAGVRTSSSIKASFTGTASSKAMTINSDNISSSGNLALGGVGSQVKVYPTDSNNISAGGVWEMPSSGTLPLTVDATSGVRGVWSTSLLVSLTCS